MTTQTTSRGRKSRSTPARLSMAAENYLLSIFRLEEQNVRVTLTVLADHLKTLPIDEGLGTSLPSKGRKPAESIVRRHRLAECLVVDLLGIDLHLAHIEAHRLEHAISEYLEEKIVKALNDPKTCPFGHPIPGSAYKSNKNTKTLDKAKQGEELVIDSVPEDDHPLLTYFVEQNLVPGREVDVKEAARTRGVITLDGGDGDLVFSYDVAAKIRVYPR